MLRSWKTWSFTAAFGLCLIHPISAQDAPAALPDAPAMTESATDATTDVPQEPTSLAGDALPAEQVPSAGEGVVVPPVQTPETQEAPPPPPPPAKPKKKVPPVFPGPKTLPPTGPWKPLYFDNDFSYMDDPNHEHLFGEELKNVPFCIFDQDVTISTGGEIRHRYMNEDNRLRPGGPIQSDNNLIRWRHYLDAKVGDRLRFYVEGIEADSFGGEAPVQAIDVNRWDLLNAFVDVKLFEGDLGTHTVRYGRQELQFGRQRLASALDWANTRRNFEGLRYMLKGADFKLDVFSVYPLNTATGFPSVAKYDSRFDQPWHGTQFTGAYFTYTGMQNTILDVYWLYQNTRVDVAAKPDGSRHTMGSRYSRLFPVLDECCTESRVWDFDTEGAFQFGEDNTQNVSAGFYTAIAGHTWKQAPWTPRVSGLFYYGSGDRTPTDGNTNTFSVMYPLGHAYWALSDNLSGQNLLDYALQVDVKPTKKTAVTMAYHWLELASSGDKAYNVAGAPVGAPGNGTNLGQALDMYGYYAFNPNFDVQAGYSWFWYGTFIDKTTPRGDATQLYIQTSLRY